MSEITDKPLGMPKFESESEEADWWASPAGREFVERRSAENRDSGTPVKGSQLLSRMNQRGTVQIALRLPQADLAKARELAEKKGLGYQTYLKMIVHEGLARESQTK
jgi:hypothetical protein